MIKDWHKLFTTECNVIDIENFTVYPIFRVGWTSLTSLTKKIYTNKEISNCKKITVLIRNPNDRFISGLNYYCKSNNLNINETHKLVKQGKLIDRHFVPQYMWLLHLYKFYKGPVTIKPFESISKMISVHKKKDKEKKIKVPVIDKLVKIDHKLMAHYNETVFLGDIIKKYKNVLSSS